MVLFNPFVGGGAVRELAGPVATATFAQAVASNNPFLAPAQASVTKAIVPADDLALGFAKMDLAE